eukprot:gene10504-14116_t
MSHGRFERFVNPQPYSSSFKSILPSVVRAGSLASVAMGVFSAPQSANSMTSSHSLDSLPLGKNAYTNIGTTYTCKILNGMWQVSGIHGYNPIKEEAIAKMAQYADNGFTTFDLADIYGPAEDYVGQFSKGRLASSLAKECNFFTKWVPRPELITRKIAEEAIDKSLTRMNKENIDLLQFHWWDYENKYYYDAIGQLMALQQEEKISNIGLTNFDTEHMIDLMDQSAPIVSNQVSFSVLDTRPLRLMTKQCEQRNVKLLCYGTLLGGFISPNWLGKKEPNKDSPIIQNNVSLRKYLPWIQYWGGWQLFQELLTQLNEIAQKHSVSLSNVAVRWVIDQPAVGGAIIGARLGLIDHILDNKKVFSFQLDNDDINKIAIIQKKGKDLFDIFGDCGSEYRRRRT